MPQSLLFDPATNRIVGVSYDANGNMLNAAERATSGTHVENRVSYAIVSGGWEYYGYALDNKRIWNRRRTVAWKLYFYGISGQETGMITTTTRFATRCRFWLWM